MATLLVDLAAVTLFDMGFPQKTPFPSGVADSMNTKFALFARDHNPGELLMRATRRKGKISQHFISSRGQSPRSSGVESLLRLSTRLAISP